MRALGAGPLWVTRLAILPSALPGMITGLRVGAGFAFRGRSSLKWLREDRHGYLIFEGARSQKTARTIVGMIVMGLPWLAIDQFHLRPIESATIQRWGLTVDGAAQVRGYMTMEAVQWPRTEVIIPGMIVIGVPGMLMDRAVFTIIERRTVERWGLLQR